MMGEVACPVGIADTPVQSGEMCIESEVGTQVQFAMDNIRQVAMGYSRDVPVREDRGSFGHAVETVLELCMSCSHPPSSLTRHNLSEMSHSKLDPHYPSS